MPQHILGYRFRRIQLFDEAVTHRSAGGRSNERLEYLGDRVLGLMIAEWLAEEFPNDSEHAWDQRLRVLVAKDTLALIAADVGLAQKLKVNNAKSRAAIIANATVLADAMEAVLGAIYLDHGIDGARRFIRKAWSRKFAQVVKPPIDPKTELQELAAKQGKKPEYTVESRAGTAHDPTFTVVVVCGGWTGRGVARSRQAAEQRAARSALRNVPRLAT